MKEPEERYVLTLTPEQEYIVEQALELLARLHIGQFERIAELLCDPRDTDYCQRRDLARDLLRLAALVPTSPSPPTSPRSWALSPSQR